MNNEEYRENIIKDHPNLYREKIYFECGDGWLPLIESLSHKLELLILEEILTHYVNDYFTYATQVKEKYGTLRFYLSINTVEMSKLVEEAEKQSITICELCGKEGKLIQNKYWYRVRCNECEKIEK